jgi:hypothetical protein
MNFSWASFEIFVKGKLESFCEMVFVAKGLTMQKVEMRTLANLNLLSELCRRE